MGLVRAAVERLVGGIEPGNIPGCRYGYGIYGIPAIPAIPAGKEASDERLLLVVVVLLLGFLNEGLCLSLGGDAFVLGLSLSLEPLRREYLSLLASPSLL